MKMLCRYDGTHLIPSSEDSVESWEKLKSGEYSVEVKRARNPQFHRLAFAVIKAMYDNQERIESFEDFRTELKILTKHYEEYINPNGVVVYIPKSWSFAHMDDIEFHEVYYRILNVAERRFGVDFVRHFEPEYVPMEDAA